MKRYLSALLFVVATATASLAVAQTQVSSASGATTVRPANWEDAVGNDRGTFTFREPETNAQIEVISTSLLTADVKDVFFNTFHDGLKAAGFVQKSQEDKSYGNHAGLLTEYNFDHSGAALIVSVFEFMIGNNAWLVVAYSGDDSADRIRAPFEEVAASLSIAE